MPLICPKCSSPDTVKKKYPDDDFHRWALSIYDHLKRIRLCLDCKHEWELV